MVFGQNLKNLSLAKKERAPEEEQNGANLSFVAPSSEELWATDTYLLKCTLTNTHGKGGFGWTSVDFCLLNIISKTMDYI